MHSSLQGSKEDNNNNNNNIGYCTHTLESTTVEVQNIQHGK